MNSRSELSLHTKLTTFSSPYKKAIMDGGIVRLTTSVLRSIAERFQKSPTQLARYSLREYLVIELLLAPSGRSEVLD